MTMMPGSDFWQISCVLVGFKFGLWMPKKKRHVFKERKTDEVPGSNFWQISCVGAVARGDIRITTAGVLGIASGDYYIWS